MFKIGNMKFMGDHVELYRLIFVDFIIRWLFLVEHR